MKTHFVLLLILGLVLERSAAQAQDDYQPGPDSIAHPDVPKGELLKGTYTAKEGSVFPGTERGYDIYLPVGYDKAKPAPFMVFQDGVIYNAPIVFDNLIAKKEIPPLIGIFLKPGIVPAANPNALPRYNRSYEYDSVSDTYSRFLIDELLPALEAKHGIKLSTDPNDAAISGNSSGGICAFMTAWHRPDRIRRVFSGVGTYVGIHGADQLPVLVRKIEPKPLRVYLQSGTGDNNLYCGDWWMANQTMERALKWAGYDVNHTWGEGGHNSKHASQIFPDVLRWLWRDHATAKEIKANPQGESKWLGYSVLGDGKWEVCWNGTEEAKYLAANIKGEVFASAQHEGKGPFDDVIASPILLRISANGDAGIFKKLDRCARGLAVGPDSLLYVVFHDEGDTLAFDGGGKSSEVFGDNERPFYAGGLSLTFDGKFMSPSSMDGEIQWGKVLPKAKRMGETNLMVKVDVSSRVRWHGRSTLSPDQTLLYSSFASSRFITSWQIREDGSLSEPQAFCHLELDDDGHTNTGGLCVDTNGWLYVATALGIQVCDQAGRMNFIIPTPQRPHDVCFGGKDLGELFIACGDKIYKRPTKAHGIVSGQMAPIKPPAPKL